MNNNSITILKAKEIDNILINKENEIIDIVEKAYISHSLDKSSLPFSTFLRFPNNSKNRIIGLPAYINEEGFEQAGLKWISSFPDNISQNKERASAILVLNSMLDGRVTTILESSIISAKRTAASAASAAQHLHKDKSETTLGMIGCGRINWEILSFLYTAFPTIQNLFLYDISTERADAFSKQIIKKYPQLNVQIVSSYNDIFTNTALISVATTASTPYINDISMCKENTTILNISLRDFAPNTILNSTNVVDDIEHVCRENTSIHLAFNSVNHTRFIQGTLADYLIGKNTVCHSSTTPVIFSPFGLGILDISLGHYIAKEASMHTIGTIIPDFY